MIKFSPYITIYGLDIEFTSMFEVVWTFSKNLHGIGTSRQRFNIHLVKSKDLERTHLEGSIKSIWRFFDQSSIDNGQEEKSRQIILSLITDCFLEVSDELKWDTHKIKDAYKKSLEELFDFEYVTKPIFNKPRTLKASIKLKLKTDKVSIYAVLTNRDNDFNKEILLIDTFEIQISGFKNFANPKWIDSKNFGFSFSNGINLTCSKDNKFASWNRDKTDEDLGFIKSLTYQKLSSPEDFVKWMNN